jgi:uncharacterized protein (DUF488 family)
MLNRQKVLLEILRLANRPVSKLELVKWAFVLTRETESRGGSSFYEFLPYHFGPYSFSLQREIDILVADGLVVSDETAWRHNGIVARETLMKNVYYDVRRIVNRFQNWAVNDVIDYVYRTYPGYTVNSKRTKLAERKSAPIAIYTAGYEGLQIDGFLDLLVQKGIYRLIDVRNNPVARRYGFHKSTLNRLCGFLGIDYVHIPELGIVSVERQNLDSTLAYDQLFDKYEQLTLHSQTSHVDRVGTLMQERSSVLVCMEAQACRCHRSRLAAAVSSRTGLTVSHFGD